MAVLKPKQLELVETADAWWQAVERRDASRDGEFVYAVTSTGIFCRPSCASRRPHRKNVRFFRQPQEAERAGFRPCLRCRPKEADGNPRLHLVRAICRFLEAHLEEPVTLARLGREFRQSPFHLQRTFKSALGITPRQYADSMRMEWFKRGLQQGRAVTTALYDAGYSSSSRLYERTASQLGMTPDKYRRGAIAVPIRYATARSPLGQVLIASTDKGICHIRLGDSVEELEQGLKREYPFAQRKRDDQRLRPFMEALVGYLDGDRMEPRLPLDIQATAFQRRVWEHLQTIPRGRTETYQEVAKALGEPKAMRAVGHACATNPVALVIPCHRVVRTDGGLGGYRWGLQRKQALLEMEKDS
ncbi:MAG: bifunctional DNA-binding transcriptional regulator/O6-methylguanine-DNA methyltransferase Ada [Terriglobales bacterium]